jgi:hypothetical protein
LVSVFETPDRSLTTSATTHRRAGRCEPAGTAHLISWRQP